MTFQDLTKIHLSGTTLSLANVYRIAHYKTVYKLGYADIDRQFSEEERIVMNQLACWVAENRGYKTVAYGWSFDRIMRSNRILCPLTLHSCQGFRSALKSCYLLRHCNGGAETLDFFASKMGWLPIDFWAAEREKEKLTNMINPSMDIWGMMLEDEGTMVPTLPQLCALIVEMEGRLNEAITAASAIPNGTFTVDTTFGSSTAGKSFSAGEAPNNVDADAHEFQWVSFPEGLEGEAHAYFSACNESKNRLADYSFGAGNDSGEPLNLQYPVTFNQPPPVFASFLSPAVAVAKLVFLSHQRNINWSPEFKETYLAASIYFLKLLGSVTSGKKFAETVATRPTTSDLPQLEGHVKVGVKFHANHERHNRVFPSLGDGNNGKEATREEIARAPSRRRVASETRDDEWERPAGYDGRPPAADRPRHEEMLKAALKRYEGSVNDLNQKLDAAFDDGKKVDLFTLLCDWPAVIDAVEETEAKELREAREAKASAYKVLDEWVYEVCEPHT